MCFARCKDNFFIAMGDVEKRKMELRAYYLAKRMELSASQKREMDNRIYGKLLSRAEFQDQQLLLTYISKDLEVDTVGIIKAALAEGKRVAVPRCDAKNYNMQFCIIDSLDDLTIGLFGILEPREGACIPIADAFSGVCIVPGLSFDRLGFRLGYGKGYYDRFLGKFSGITIGLCYSCCVQAYLPHDTFDRPVELLVTDRFVQTISSENSMEGQGRKDL